MRPSKAQLCDRARQWVSLRLDDELSELENALLEAHLARCAPCRAFAADTDHITSALRTLGAARPPVPVVVALPRRRTRRWALQTAAAAALVVVAAALGSALNAVNGPDRAQTVAAVRKHTAMIASADTADALRKLRRPGLIEAGRAAVPRNRAIPGETV